MHISKRGAAATAAAAAAAAANVIRPAKYSIPAASATTAIILTPTGTVTGHVLHVKKFGGWELRRYYHGRPCSSEWI